MEHSGRLLRRVHPRPHTRVPRHQEAVTSWGRGGPRSRGCEPCPHQVAALGLAGAGSALLTRRAPGPLLPASAFPSEAPQHELVKAGLATKGGFQNSVSFIQLMGPGRGLYCFSFMNVFRGGGPQTHTSRFYQRLISKPGLCLGLELLLGRRKQVHRYYTPVNLGAGARPPQQSC